MEGVRWKYVAVTTVGVLLGCMAGTNRAQRGYRLRILRKFDWSKSKYLEEKKKQNELKYVLDDGGAE